MGEREAQIRCCCVVVVVVVVVVDDPCSDPAEKVVGVAPDEEEAAGDAEGSEGPRQEQVEEEGPE